ncbi:uncharacterized protein EV154DRAFT_491893, partial [Mucor mucedo]|uniref:uncharacterized protein n=1 Tax=Mucor mucedo TaxID=29922 RepID=UPI00222036C4
MPEQDLLNEFLSSLTDLVVSLCDEMPRKVTVYITAPPGDGLEKSRTWFCEYVK